MLSCPINEFAPFILWKNPIDPIVRLLWDYVEESLKSLKPQWDYVPYCSWDDLDDQPGMLIGLAGSVARVGSQGSQAREKLGTAPRSIKIPWKSHGNPMEIRWKKNNMENPYQKCHGLNLNHVFSSKSCWFASEERNLWGHTFLAFCS
jgi:hypothetical protein